MAVSSFVIEGGRPLAGEIVVSGNKSAALPMLAATLLTDEAITLDNVPDIDVRTMLAALADLGGTITQTLARGRRRSRTMKSWFFTKLSRARVCNRSWRCTLRSAVPVAHAR